MLAAAVAWALACLVVHRAGASAQCWDERPSRAARNGSCVAPQPFLIFGHGRAIHRLGLDGKNHRRLVASVGSSVLLDFHFREERLYWADTHTGVIYKASVRGAHRQKLYSSDRHISGLAVDWIWNSLYWTSGEKGEIKTMYINGKNERTIMRHLSKPSSIGVDPRSRFLFWLSGGSTPGVQRCDVTGQMKTTLVKMAGEEPRALSIDREDRRLFWAQFGPQGESAIASCDYSGNLLRVMDQPLRSESLGLSVFLDYLYYTDAASRVIKQVNKYTGGKARDVSIKQMAKPPVGIRVIHPRSQPADDPPAAPPGCDEQSGNCVNICSSLADRGVCECSGGFALSKQGTHCEDVNECSHWNHGCSLGCENIPGSYFCTCPKGYALLPDRKTCREIISCEGNMTECGHGCLATGGRHVCVCPEGSVLQEDGRACTGCSSADRGGCSQTCSPVAPGRWRCGCHPGYRLHQDGKRCSAAGPPPFLLVANLVDVRRMSADGSEEETLVEEPRGTILALDYDPIQNNVYFASSSQKVIERVGLSGGSRRVVVSEGLGSPEGLAIDWIHHKMYWTDKSLSTVDCSDLVRYHKETIVSKGLEEPRGIAVHPLAKKLFWTDTGSRPAVESSSLDGSGRAVVAAAGLSSPTGLAVDFADDRLFWCDQKRGLIETAALDGSDRRVLSENQVGRPFDLAVFEDSLWVSDWQHQRLRSVHKRSGKTLRWIHAAMVQPASVVVVHPLARPGADVCLHLNGGCMQVCESRLGSALCSCLPRFVLSSDGKSCRASNATAGDGGLPSLGNQTFNDESAALTGGEADFLSVFTDKMVSDQQECHSLRCHAHAHCLLDSGSPRCLCEEGFTGDGRSCVDIDECELETHGCGENAECQNTEGKYLCKCRAGHPDTGRACEEVDRPSSWATPGPPVQVTTQHHSGDGVESCPASHDTYCLYQGVCFYFPEMESYACNCVSGYMGERCQFSDLEWLELQQAEKEKRRNVAIAACMVVLVSLLSVTACVTYCYGTRRIFHKQPSVDNVSETSVTDDSTLEAATTAVPQFYLLAASGLDGKLLSSPVCPRPAVCPSCSSADSSPGDSGSSCRHNGGYECSVRSAASMQPTQQTLRHPRPPKSSLLVFHPDVDRSENRVTSS
ncbi:pro-epidermal growth factor [Salarias fasciatus]|uniref:pro-epidermal growth factor n=1 Tax=Salarias fasciatus TaxID=181472 RepID=UPI0011770408|nr:pro-epidermal growth factor [Salarias fasciatus]